MRVCRRVLPLGRTVLAKSVAPYYERGGKLGGRCSLEPAKSVVEPNYYFAGIDEIGPHQIHISILVYIACQQRSRS